ncbi:DUF2165 family protein [Campylobacter subantarcticus]|uniref:Uncharacterized protein n=1 Tax=Campylobacter subantarcticus LMG 24374 TaxID=1388751 RepID=A0A0A8HDU9_9BACT|nr:DUF2165 family protein [Campylobacter subantarcticus]AJC91074.1 hypothetical protein (DUF2165 domain) [Campylobacter subantarcticus LMG 24374]
MNCNCGFFMTNIVRYSKMIILLTVACGNCFFGNIADYNSNFQFLKHVMSMDTKPDYLGNVIFIGLLQILLSIILPIFL